MTIFFDQSEQLCSKKIGLVIKNWWNNSPCVIIFLKEYLMELSFQKCYFLFLEILNQKENELACKICFEVRIPKGKMKSNFWQKDSFHQKDDNKWANVTNSFIEMVFCYRICSDLLWEKIVLVIEKNLKFEAEGR